MQGTVQKITPCLCYNNQAEKAVNFYTSVFKDAEILSVSRYGEEDMKALASLPEDIRPGPEGSVSTITFRLFGQKYWAANCGAYFTFTQAISLVVNCENQAEIDEYWEKLSEGGEQQQCGWLKDKFDVSWQIVPAVLEQMLNDPDNMKKQAVMAEVYKMKKMDIETLKRAYDKI